MVRATRLGQGSRSRTQLAERSVDTQRRTKPLAELAHFRALLAVVPRYNEVVRTSLARTYLIKVET